MYYFEYGKSANSFMERKYEDTRQPNIVLPIEMYFAAFDYFELKGLCEEQYEGFIPVHLSDTQKEVIDTIGKVSDKFGYSASNIPGMVSFSITAKTPLFVDSFATNHVYFFTDERNDNGVCRPYSKFAGVFSKREENPNDIDIWIYISQQFLGSIDLDTYLEIDPLINDSDKVFMKTQKEHGRWLLANHADLDNLYLFSRG